jgi:hypothetical protein
MTQGRPPISGRTWFYGIFADPIAHAQTPAILNELLDRRGVDAVFVPFHVTAEHFAAAVAGIQHLRNFAGYGVGMPHKAMAACLCDVLLPNARACGVVNAVRIEPDGRLIGETFDGVGMVKAIAAQRILDANTRVLLVGAGGGWAGDCGGAGPRWRRIRGHHQSDPGQGQRVGTDGAVCCTRLWGRKREPPLISSSMRPPWGSMGRVLCLSKSRACRGQPWWRTR